MTREQDMFTSFEENDCPSDTITFGDNSEGKVLGYGKIYITTEHSISKALLVDKLDYNLLSISQTKVWPFFGEVVVPIILVVT
jgi:hypothetical protein